MSGEPRLDMGSSDNRTQIISENSHPPTPRYIRRLIQDIWWSTPNGGRLIIPYVSLYYSPLNRLISPTQRTHLPYTPFDTALDRTSINPRFQAFEKFISGMYLGELTRGVLLALVDAVVRCGEEETQTPDEGETTKHGPKYTKNQSLLFNGKSTRVLNEKWALDTSVMSEVEEAWEGGGEFSVGGDTPKSDEDVSVNDTGRGTMGITNSGLTDITNGSGGGQTIPNEIGENPLWNGDDGDYLPDWEVLSGFGASTSNPSTSNPSDTTSIINTKLERVRQVVVRRLGYEDAEVGLRDAAIVRWVSHLVARRAALLSGVAVAAVLIQTGRAGMNAVNGLNGTNGVNAVNVEQGEKEEETIGIGVDGRYVSFSMLFEPFLPCCFLFLGGGSIYVRGLCFDKF